MKQKYTKDHLISKLAPLHAIATYSNDDREAKEALGLLGRTIQALNTKSNQWDCMSDSYNLMLETIKYLKSEKVKEVFKN